MYVLASAHYEPTITRKVTLGINRFTKHEATILLDAEDIMRNARLQEAQAEIKSAGWVLSRSAMSDSF